MSQTYDRIAINSRLIGNYFNGLRPVNGLFIGCGSRWHYARELYEFDVSIPRSFLSRYIFFRIVMLRSRISVDVVVRSSVCFQICGVQGNFLHSPVMLNNEISRDF